MADLRRFGFADFLLLVLVVALAGAARAGYLMTCCDNGRSPGPLLVQDPRFSFGGGSVGSDLDTGLSGRTRSSGKPANNDSAGPLAGFGGETDLDDLVASIKSAKSFDLDTFSSRSPFSRGKERSAYSAPGYPVVVGLLARVIAPEALPRAIRWGQCGLGALTVGLYFLFARRAFASLFVATLTGVFCAIHPFWVINTAAIDDGVLASFLLGTTLFLGVRSVQASDALSSLLYGLLLAALALVRAALLPLAVVALLWFLVRTRVVLHGWLCALLGFLGFVIGLSPWMVYNWQRFHDVVPIVDSAYADLWVGNNPNATGGPATAAERDGLADTLRGLPREQRYAQLGGLVESELRRDQVVAVRRRLAAGVFFFLGQHWFDDGRLALETPDASEMPDWLRRSYPGALAGSLFAMLLLGVLGWRWTYGWRFTAMPSSLAVMWIPLPYILSHADWLSGPRLPLDGVLLSYAAFAIGCLTPGVSAVLLAGYRPPVAPQAPRR